MAVDVQKPHEMSALIDTQTCQLRAQLLGAMVCREAGEPAPQRLHLRRAVEPEEPAECGRVTFLEMLGPLDAQQRHEQERQQGRAQAIEGRTDLTVELAADPKQPALDQARESEQDADTRNRGPLAEERRGIIEQPQMGELPIEAAIARVAVEAHRHRLATASRRGDRIVASFAEGVVRSASSPLDFADGTPAAGGAPAAAVVIPANASCALSAGVEGPTSLRIAFSLTPSRCATARLLIPWLFSSSMLRRRCPEIRRRPRRQPSSRPSAAIPPCT